MALGDYEQRALDFPLEIREVSARKRIAELLLVPYGETTMDAGNPRGERFLRGSFRKAASEFRGRKRPLYLFRAHEHGRAVGQAMSLQESAEGPIGEFRMGRTAPADEVLMEMEDGLLGGVSVGFRAIKDRLAREDGAREILEASLIEASVLPLGAYEGAGVLSLRGPQDPEPPDLSWISVPPAPKIDPSRSLLPWV